MIGVVPAHKGFSAIGDSYLRGSVEPALPNRFADLRIRSMGSDPSRFACLWHDGSDPGQSVSDPGQNQPYSTPSFFFSKSLTEAGFALPPELFMTWPTNQFNRGQTLRV
jgi:hypothetical protein